MEAALAELFALLEHSASSILLRRDALRDAAAGHVRARHARRSAPASWWRPTAERLPHLRPLAVELIHAHPPIHDDLP